jgi:nucleotide-binding universal stress UspA family protein
MKAPTRILVPIDMSVFSVTALQYAQDMAEHFGAEIVVLHIAEEDDIAARIPKKEREKMSPQELDQRMKSVVAHMLLDHNVVTQSLRIEIRHGSPAEEIVKAAPVVHADLIVMCTHGRSGVSHLLMGSVAEKVVRNATCPVLTLKPDEFYEVINVTQDDIVEGLHLT